MKPICYAALIGFNLLTSSEASACVTRWQRTAESTQ